jgi:hypothetical protein
VARLVPVIAMLVAASAAGAATLRERTVAGPVGALGIAGTDVGYAVEHRPRCHEVRAWEVGSRADRRVASHCFQGTSTGSGVAGVATTQGRSLWLTYTGGNLREWSLWTQGGRGRIRRIAFESAPVDDPAPIVLGRPWEGSLPYAVGRTVVVVAQSGARRFALTAPARVVRVSAHSRGYAAVLETGSVLAISLAGKPIREHAFDAGVEDAVLAAVGLVAKTRAGLEIRDGASVRTVDLPRGARFFGYSEGIVAYGSGRELRLRSLRSGADWRHRTLAPRFHAALARRGLTWASGRTLGFSVWAGVNEPPRGPGR